MRFPPWSSFYFRNTYAEREDADIPNIPHELDPYERFVVRFAFASKAAAIFLVGGLVYGGLVALINWRFGTLIVP